MREFIEFKDVTFSYNNGKNTTNNVLYKVNFSINKGEFVAVLGRNGCGKSTLAKHMNAILVPSSGKVTVNGLDGSVEKNVYNIRKKVGLVLQNPDNQIVAGVVEEDVAFGPENLGIQPCEIRKRVDDALKCVGMYEYRESSPYKLSGGQKQRVAIAGILAMKPECIVFDEPTSMLDPVGRSEVINTAIKLNRQKNTTIVLITHYMEEAVLADRLLVMDKGRIKFDGKPKEFFKDVRAIKEVGLSLTQPMDLLYRLNKRGYSMRINCVNEKECAEEIVRYMGDGV